jgi:hypothetical protein
VSDLPADRLADPFSNSLKLLPLWFFQSIAAFPTRNERAPALVYASGAFLLLAFLGTAWWIANRRLRVALAGTLIVAVGVPFSLTLLTFSRLGGEWQGRYGLPYAFGLLLIASLALERTNFRHRLQAPFLLSSWVALLMAHTISVTNVLLIERRESPLSGDPSWIMPHPFVVVVLMIFAGVALAIAASQHSSSPELDEHSVSLTDSKSARKRSVESTRSEPVRTGRQT